VLGEDAGHVYVGCEILVDAEPIADFGDVAASVSQLRASTVGGGHWLWACWCGDPECAGLLQPVHVVHTHDTISWEVAVRSPARTFVVDTEGAVASQATDPAPKRRWVFAAPAYRSRLEELVGLLPAWIDANVSLDGREIEIVPYGEEAFFRSDGWPVRAR
jgi:hypothetical protein